MEFFEDRIPWQPRRALAQRREDRRVRARHSGDGIGPRQEQIPFDPRLRRPTEGTHRVAGPRRRGVLPQHQGARPMKRRKFLKTASAAGLSLAAAPRFPAWLSTPGDTVRVAVMGLNGRGAVLARTFARAAHAEVAYVCDVDSLVLAKGVSAVAGAQSKSPKGLGD